jgi:hypothetical protein
MSEEPLQRSVPWESMAAAICFVCAPLFLAIGFVFTTRLLLNATLHPWLHDLGLILLIIGIPVLILGGHFMDLKEKKGNR